MAMYDQQRQTKTMVFSRWGFLPAEIQYMILDLLNQHKSRGCYAVVSKEWQTFFEAKNFRHLKINQHDLQQFAKMAKPRRRKPLIKNIWLNIELQSYDCHLCGWAERSGWHGENKFIIENAIMNLFGFLKIWRRGGGRDLALELNAYYPSDCEHWQRHCSVGGPGEDGPAGEIHDPKHGFEHGRQVKPPEPEAIKRFLIDNYVVNRDPLGTEALIGLPKVTAVTKFTIRRQFRRQFPSKTASRIFSSFPRLETLVWEPWRTWGVGSHEFWDIGCEKHFTQTLPKSLKRVSVFEDFNEDYTRRLLLAWGHPMASPMRIASPFLSSVFSSRRIQLEELSISFMVDAEHFFDTCQPEWEWEQLRSLTLTSRSMTPLKEEEVTDLLLKASKAAMLMPKLQTMIVWNGAKGKACAFIYNGEDSSITWRGTWEMKLGQKVVDAWRKVDYESSRKPFRVKSEVISDEILSHGDAIHHLDLPAGVIDPVSLWQIRNEHLVSYREPDE